MHTISFQAPALVGYLWTARQMLQQVNSGLDLLLARACQGLESAVEHLDALGIAGVHDCRLMG